MQHPLSLTSLRSVGTGIIQAPVKHIYPSYPDKLLITAKITLHTHYKRRKNEAKSLALTLS